jgi:hypothetical protein
LDPAQQDYAKQIEYYSLKAVEVARGNHLRLVELIREMHHLVSVAQDSLIAQLHSAEISALPAEQRALVWRALTNLIRLHSRFSEQEWAFDHGRVEDLSTLAARLQPDSPQLRVEQLFSNRDFDLLDDRGDFGEQQKRLQIARNEALAEIAAAGTDAVLEFSSTVESPWRVGWSFGVLASQAAELEILPRLLDSAEPSGSEFISAFVLSRFERLGYQWADSVDNAKWSVDQIAKFISLLPFQRETWDRAARKLGQNESIYWKNTGANPYQAGAGLSYAARQLLLVARPLAALRCLSQELREQKILDWRLASEVLIECLRSSEPPQQLDRYAILSVVKALQQNADLNSDLENEYVVEWGYLQLLERHEDAAPILLERRLAIEPSFFCEVIQLVYRSKKGESADAPITEAQQRMATHAYRLLSEWRRPPGTLDDGAFDGEVLRGWWKAVHETCELSGHIEIASLTLGRVLTHAPADPSGLWLHRGAAELLNAKSSEPMREGFRTQLYNSRGVHWVDPSGEAERALARTYHERTEALEQAGYHRLASSVRELAEGYEREARHVVSTELY